MSPRPIGRLAHRLDNGSRDVPFVEGVRAALGNRAQRRRELGVLQEVAHGPRITGPIEVMAARAGREAIGTLPSQQHLEARRDGKALLGQPDRRLEQPRPGKATVLLVQGFEEPHGSGNADARAAGDGLGTLEQDPVCEEAVGPGGGRSRLASVIGPQLCTGRIPVQRERAATDARGLRLDQVQDQLHADSGVGCAAACPQQLQPRLHRQGIGGGDHVGRGGGGRRRRRPEVRPGAAAGRRPGPSRRRSRRDERRQRETAEAS